MYLNPDDTIVALSTPAGIGALGVIRMSGNRAIEIAARLFSDKQLGAAPGYSLHFGRIVDPAGEQVIDEVILSLFRSPASFTGEDVVEISAHGSPFILSRILELCVTNGARLAAPGEYTMRAYLNGKLDLAQAEAVGDLIQAETSGAHRLAMQQMRGGYSAELNQLRDKLIEFVSLLELELDFAEEDVEFADRERFMKFADRLIKKITTLIDSFSYGNALKNGISVAIIGKPNAGKSSLLNALLNDDRAIVSEIPGTTRDTIEETLNIRGTLFRLIDTAGIREHSNDPIENLGIERSHANAAKADIILYLIDLTNHDEDEFPWLRQYNGKTIEVFNKWELWIEQMSAKGIDVTPAFTNTWINARTGEGVAKLRDVLSAQVHNGKAQQGNIIVSNARHLRALKQTLDALHSAMLSLKSGLSTELVSLDLRRALFHLGEITGTVEVDRDILGAIFGRFCIGK